MKARVSLALGAALLAGASFAAVEDFESYANESDLTTPLDGGTGWVGNWVAVNNSGGTGVVVSDSPLNSGGQYLDIDLYNSAGGQAMGIGRQLAEGAPADDFTVTFDWRADLVGSFDTSNDRFEFYSSADTNTVNGAGGGGANTSPYLMGIFGVSRGANSEANVFTVYNAANTGDAWGGDNYYSLGSEATGGDGTTITLTEGTTYSVTINVYAATKTWDVSVTDGTTTASSIGLKWWGNDAQPCIAFGCRGDAADETRAFSVDSIDVITVAPPFEISVYPTGVTNSAPVLLAEIVNGNSDFSSATLSLDGAQVAENNTPSGTANNSITYTASGLEMGVHTGKVVVVGTSPAVSVTNSWTFSVAADGEYVPSDSFTLIDDFESYATVASFTNGVTTAGAWRYVDGAGIPADDESTAVVGIDNFDGDKIIQFGGNSYGLNSDFSGSSIAEGGSGQYFFRIKSSSQSADAWFGLSDLPSDTAFNWGDFEVQIGLKNVDGSTSDGTFDLVARSGSVQTNGLLSDVPVDVWVNVRVEVFNNEGATNDTYNVYASYGSEAPALVAANLSFRNGTTDSLSSFLTKSGSTQPDRSAGLDDVFYNASIGLSVIPTIQVFEADAGTVTLTWASESMGTYTVSRRPSLTSGDWTPIITGIPGTEPTTSTNIDVGGTASEFYKVEGEFQQN